MPNADTCRKINAAAGQGDEQRSAGSTRSAEGHHVKAKRVQHKQHQAKSEHDELKVAVPCDLEGVAVQGHADDEQAWQHRGTAVVIIHNIIHAMVQSCGCEVVRMDKGK